ncbi:MAG: KaiC/GvpD/RAD55 family RecA-like ATPase [Natronomonas sp.]|jgi:KaiC/GvpD/RAD55 family RecA-like ATPase
MEYTLAIENTPETIPGGTGLLLFHPSTGETDRIDTQFLKTDTDHILVISTRTTAREVEQKLEHYEVDEDRAMILDTLSVERGYTRRQSDRVKYVSRPENIEGIVDETRAFLDSHEGKLRISFDSITELIYYADETRAREAVVDILDLIDEYDAVGLFHFADGVHDETVHESFRELFDGVIELGEDGSISSSL